MPESDYVNGLSKTEQAFLHGLLTLTPADLAVWVDRVYKELPRKPVPPLADSDVFSVFTYTHTLLVNYAPEQVPLLVRLLFRKLVDAEPNPAHAAALFDLISALQLIKPYAYTDRLGTMVSNSTSPYRYLWTPAPRHANLHIQLMGLYSSLYDGDQTPVGQPDSFLAYLNAEIGKHPARGPFIEVSLRHYAQKAPRYYFEFATKLVDYYYTLNEVSHWSRSFELLLDQRIQDAYQLYRWFRQIRNVQPLRTEPAFQQWQDALRLQLSLAVENRGFYRTNPYIVLLYAELIAGLKPPVASVLAQLCDLELVPIYDGFEKELLQTTHRLISESVRAFGVFSEDTLHLPGFRFSSPQKLISLYIDDNELIVTTRYELTKDDTRYAPRFLNKIDQEAYVTNTPRFKGLKKVCDEFIISPNEEVNHQRQESELRSL